MEPSDILRLIQDAIKPLSDRLNEATTDVAVLSERISNAILERREWQQATGKDVQEIFNRLRAVEGTCQLLADKEEGVAASVVQTHPSNGLNPQRIIFDLVKLIITTIVGIILALKLTGKL